MIYDTNFLNQNCMIREYQEYMKTTFSTEIVWSGSCSTWPASSPLRVRASRTVGGSASLYFILYTLYFILYFILYKWEVSLLSPFASILWLFRHLARMTNTFFWVFRLWIWEFEIYYLKKIFVFADGKNVSGTSVRRAILLANRFTTSIWKFGVRDTNPSTCNTALRSKDFGRLRQQYHKEG